MDSKDSVRCDQTQNLLGLLSVDEDDNINGNVDVEKGLKLESDDDEAKEITELLKHLQGYNDIKKALRRLESTNSELLQASDEILESLSTSRDKIAIKVEKLIARSRSDSQFIKKRLTGDLQLEWEEYKKASKVEGSIEAEIRNVMLIYYTKKYYDAHKQYSTLANKCRQQVHNSAKREITLIAKEPISEEQIDEIIEKGMDGNFLEAMLQGQGQKEELERLQKRSDIVNQINTEVRNLLTMFQDMAALVDAQQETVDNIQTHIESAKDYTGQAAIELFEAANYLDAARRKMCICAVIVLIVIGVIVGVIVATTQN
mmetsp:Transcript_24226/g.36328  ORF Transcript_24226/g.36328 Transcript_24226/m.36328 type:complete len:316 (-) Transcript_24226:144-1091(-)|eukprot:CAMPEP_0167754808 /NCGR_PEP_ID=MMETSP0110_2-20121227/8477_1 /TAXON_ID=629695 /ORGANISM="Gymnochlora sp., Strain CCMP2014" /LENGTH=315 /DNA_ID=CAMNT_0007640731 /DNA_START=36 /DNA_END=983 /DNA_ORIENTATION=-